MREHWMSVGTPWWFNCRQRKRDRDKARRDIRRGREPQPDYGDLHYW